MLVCCTGHIHERHHIRVTQEMTAEHCMQLVPTSVPREQPSDEHMTLERWIIKPLGDGICVEGHRRLTNSHLCLVALYPSLLVA